MSAETLLININKQKMDILGQDISKIRANINLADSRISNIMSRITDEEHKIGSKAGNKTTIEYISLAANKKNDYLIEISILKAKTIEYSSQINRLSKKWLTLNNQNNILSKALLKKNKAKKIKQQILLDRSAEDIINGAKK